MRSAYKVRYISVIVSFIILVCVGVTLAWMGFTFSKQTQISFVDVALEVNTDAEEVLSNVAIGDVVVDSVSFTLADSSTSCFVRAKLTYKTLDNPSNNDKAYMCVLNNQDINTYSSAEYKWEKATDNYYYLVDANSVPLEVDDPNFTFVFCEDVIFTGATELYNSVPIPDGLLLDTKVQAIQSKNVEASSVAVLKNAFHETFGADEFMGYVVKFNTGGANAIAAQTFFSAGDKVVRPEDPYLGGYEFVGWYTDSEFTNSYDFNTVVSQNFTLYAKFGAPPYTLDLNYTSSQATINITNAGGDSLQDGDNIYIGQTYTITVSPKTGYVFESITVGPNNTIVNNSQYTFVAEFCANDILAIDVEMAPITYYLTLKDPEGNNMHTYDLTYDTPFVLPNVWSLTDGYSASTHSFEGWATTSNGAVAYADADSVINLATTNGATYYLYAKFELLPMTLDLNFDSVGSNVILTSNSITYQDGDEITLGQSFTISITVKNGYNFNGIKLGPSQTLVNQTSHTFTIDSVANNVYEINVLTAPISYVLYLKDAKENTLGTYQMAYGTPLTLPDVWSICPSKNQSTDTFYGWSYSIGGESAFANQASVNNLTTTDSATVTLYSVFASDGFVVKLNYTSSRYYTGIYYSLDDGATWVNNEEDVILTNVTQIKFKITSDDSDYETFITSEILNLDIYYDGYGTYISENIVLTRSIDDIVIQFNCLDC